MSNPTITKSAFFSLKATPAEAARTLEQFSSSELTWMPESWDGMPGENFTAIEQICHLRDIEIDGYQERIKAITQEDNPFLPSLNGYELSAQRNYKEANLESAVEEFRKARIQTLKVIDSIETNQWNRKARFEGYGDVTLFSLIHFLCSHDFEHLASLRWLLGKMKEHKKMAQFVEPNSLIKKDMGRFHIVMNEKGDGSVSESNDPLIKTSIPVEFGGSGLSPSSTDLLAISLASCIGSSLATSGNPFWSPQNFRLDASRTLACNPKMLANISINVVTKSLPDDDAQRSLEHAIKTSTVKRALSNEINLDIKILSEEER